MTRLVERVGGRLRYNLHRGQLAAWDLACRFILILAGTQGGKTSLGSLWLYREIQRTYVPGELNDYLAASANYDLFRLKMLPELVTFFCIGLGWTYNKADRIIVNPSGDIRIIIRSAESQEGLESATAKAAWLDEWGLPNVSIDCWFAILRRLSLAQGRVLITTTPYNMGWLYTEFYCRWKGGNPDYAVVSFKSTDNPAFPRKEYERARASMPRWKFEMMYNGVFTRPAGLIYDCYDEGKHVLPAFSIPAEWSRIVGMDFGAVNPAEAWFAYDRQAEMYFAYREAVGGQGSIGERCGRLLGYREPVSDWVGGAPSENEQRWAYNAAGVPVVAPYVSDVETQIDRIYSLFQQDRLYIFDTCAGLRAELGTYSRELDAAGEPTPKIADKATFHRLDALRYAGTVMNVEDKRPEYKPEQEQSLRVPKTRQEEDKDPYNIYNQVDEL